MMLVINAIICLSIAICLFLFKREKSSYKFSYAILAWGLICSSASVAILIFFNQIAHAEIAQTVMNLLILICAIKTKGNVAQFIYRFFHHQPIQKQITKKGNSHE